MPNIEDYIGRGKEMLADADDNPEPERPFPVGTLVVVTGICDVDQHVFPQVVTITENTYSAAGRCGSHNYYAIFHTGSGWCFAESECDLYTGQRTDTPFLLCDDDDDDDDAPADRDRPTTGDRVIVWEAGGGITVPRQVVTIERDDHDDAPYKADLWDNDGNIQNSWYFAEDDCERYTGSDQRSTPFLLDGSEPLRIGDTVIVTHPRMDEDDCESDDPKVGMVGVLTKIDQGDEDQHYLIDVKGTDYWAHKVKKHDVKAAFVYAIRTDPPQDNGDDAMADETLVGPFTTRDDVIAWADKNQHGLIVRLRKP